MCDHLVRSIYFVRISEISKANGILRNKFLRLNRQRERNHAAQYRGAPVIAFIASACSTISLNVESFDLTPYFPGPTPRSYQCQNSVPESLPSFACDNATVHKTRRQYNCPYGNKEKLTFVRGAKVRVPHGRVSSPIVVRVRQVSVVWIQDAHAKLLEQKRLVNAQVVRGGFHPSFDERSLVIDAVVIPVKKTGLIYHVSTIAHAVQILK